MHLKYPEINVGCAVLIPSEKFSVKIKLNGSSSVFVGEAIAIFQALEYIKCYQVQKAVIYTDSMSVLESLKSDKKFSPNINTYILDIYLLLCKLHKEGVSVNFIWVKAHVGIIYNEQVDELAKISALSGLKLGFKDSLSDCYNTSKSKMFTDWSKFYTQFKTDNPNNLYSQVEDKIPRVSWYKNLSVPRKFITTISRLRFGHACFAKHLKRLGVIESEMCTLCNTVGDLDHIFFECRYYTDASTELLRKLSGLNVPLPTNLLHLLSYKNIAIYKVLMEFLNEINLRL